MNTNSTYSFILLMLRPPPSSPLFPYTTLFRSCSKATRRSCWRPLLRRSRVPRLREPVAVDLERPRRALRPARRVLQRQPVARSEEHTSELQSHVNLVCRLLLEKKKKYICPHLP